MRSQLPIRRSRAFSLVEVIVATAIAGGLLVAALSAVGATASARRFNSDNETAVRLAKDLMDEILSKVYEDLLEPGKIGTETDEKDVRKYDTDVDDYHEFEESPPLTPDGDLVTTQAGWERSVKVFYASRSDIDVKAADDEGLKRIEVTASRYGRPLCTLVAVRSRGWDNLMESR